MSNMENTKQQNIQETISEKEVFNKAYTIPLEKYLPYLESLPPEEAIKTGIDIHAYRLLSSAYANKGQFYDYFIKEPIKLDPELMYEILNSAKQQKQELVAKGILKDDDAIKIFDDTDRAFSTLWSQLIASAGMPKRAGKIVVPANVSFLVASVIPTITSGNIPDEFKGSTLEKGIKALQQGDKNRGLALLYHFVNNLQYQEEPQIDFLSLFPTTEEERTEKFLKRFKQEVKTPSGVVELTYKPDVLVELPTSPKLAKIPFTERYITQTTAYYLIEKGLRYLFEDKELPKLLQGSEKLSFYRTIYPETKDLLDYASIGMAMATDIYLWYAFGEIAGFTVGKTAKITGIVDKVAKTHKLPRPLVERIANKLGDFVLTDYAQYKTRIGYLNTYYSPKYVEDYRRRFGSHTLVASAIAGVSLPYVTFLTHTRNIPKLTGALATVGIASTYNFLVNGVPSDPIGLTMAVSFPLSQGLSMLRMPTLPQRVSIGDMKLELNKLNPKEWEGFYNAVRSGKVPFEMIEEYATKMSDLGLTLNTKKALQSYRVLSDFARISGAEIVGEPSMPITRYFEEKVRKVSGEAGVVSRFKVEEVDNTRFYSEIENTLKEIFEARKVAKEEQARERLLGKIDDLIEKNRNLDRAIRKAGIVPTPETIKSVVGDKYDVIVAIPLSQKYLEGTAVVRDIKLNLFKNLEANIKAKTNFAKLTIPEDATLKRRAYIIPKGKIEDVVSGISNIPMVRTPDNKPVFAGYLLIPHTDGNTYNAYRHNVMKLLDGLGITLNKSVGFNIAVVPLENNGARVVFSYVKDIQNNKPVVGQFEIVVKDFNIPHDEIFTRDLIKEVKGEHLHELSDYGRPSKIKLFQDDTSIRAIETKPIDKEALRVATQEAERLPVVEQAIPETPQVEPEAPKVVEEPEPVVSPRLEETVLTKQQETISITEGERIQYKDVYYIKENEDGSYSLYLDRFRNDEIIETRLIDVADKKENLKIPDEVRKELLKQEPQVEELPKPPLEEQIENIRTKTEEAKVEEEVKPVVEVKKPEEEKPAVEEEKPKEKTVKRKRKSVKSFVGFVASMLHEHEQVVGVVEDHPDIFLTQLLLLEDRDGKEVIEAINNLKSLGKYNFKTLSYNEVKEAYPPLDDLKQAEFLGFFKDERWKRTYATFDIGEDVIKLLERDVYTWLKNEGYEFYYSTHPNRLVLKRNGKVVGIAVVQDGPHKQETIHWLPLKELQQIIRKKGQLSHRLETQKYSIDRLPDLGNDDFVIYKEEPSVLAKIFPERSEIFQIRMKGLDRGLAVIRKGEKYILFYHGFGITDDGYIVPVINLLETTHGYSNFIDGINHWIKQGKLKYGKYEGKFIDIITGKEYRIGDKFDILPIVEVKTVGDNLVFKTPKGDFTVEQILDGVARYQKMVGESPQFFPQLTREQKILFALEVLYGGNIEYIADPLGLYAITGVDGQSGLYTIINDYKEKVKNVDLLTRAHDLFVARGWVFGESDVDILLEKILHENDEELIGTIISLSSRRKLFHHIYETLTPYIFRTIKGERLNNLYNSVNGYAKTIPAIKENGFNVKRVVLRVNEFYRIETKPNLDLNKLNFGIVFEINPEKNNLDLTPQRFKTIIELYGKEIMKESSGTQLIFRVSDITEPIFTEGGKKVDAHYVVVINDDFTKVYLVGDDFVKPVAEMRGKLDIKGNISGFRKEGEKIVGIEDGEGKLIELNCGVPIPEILGKTAPKIKDFVVKVIKGAFQVINPHMSEEEIRTMVNKIPDSAVGVLNWMIPDTEDEWTPIAHRLTFTPDNIRQRVNEYFSRGGYDIEDLEIHLPQEVRAGVVENLTIKKQRAIETIKKAYNEATRLDEKAGDFRNRARLVGFLKQFFGNITDEQALELLENPEKMKFSNLVMLEPVFRNMRRIGGVLTPRANPLVYRMLVGLIDISPESFDIDARLPLGIANPNFFPIAIAEIEKEYAYRLTENFLNKALSDIEAVYRRFGISSKVDESEIIGVWDIFEKAINEANERGIREPSPLIAQKMAENDVNPVLLFMMVRDPYNPLKLEDVINAYAQKYPQEEILDAFNKLNEAFTVYYKKTGMILADQIGADADAFVRNAETYVHRTYTGELFNYYGIKKAKKDLQEVLREISNNNAEILEFPILMASKNAQWYNLDGRVQVKHYANYFARTVAYNNIYPYAIGLSKLFALDRTPDKLRMYNNALLGVFFGVDPARGETFNIVGDNFKFADLVSTGREVSYFITLSTNFSPAIKNWGQAWLLFGFVNPRYAIEGYYDLIKNPELRKNLETLWRTAEYGRVRQESSKALFLSDFARPEYEAFIGKVKSGMLPLWLWEMADGNLRTLATVSAYGIGKRLGLSLPEITKLSLYLQQATQFSFAMSGRPLFLYNKAIAMLYKFSWFMKYPFDILSSYMIWNLKNGVYSPLVISLLTGMILTNQIRKKLGINLSDILLSPVTAIKNLKSLRQPFWITQLATSLGTFVKDIAKAVAITDWSSPEKFREFREVANTLLSDDQAKLLPALARWLRFRDRITKDPIYMRKHGLLEKVPAFLGLFFDLEQDRVKANQLEDIQYVRDLYNRYGVQAEKYFEEGLRTGNQKYFEKAKVFMKRVFRDPRFKTIANRYILFTPTPEGAPFVYGVDPEKEIPSDEMLMSYLIRKTMQIKGRKYNLRDAIKTFAPSYTITPIAGQRKLTPLRMWEMYDNYQDLPFGEWIRQEYGEDVYRIYKAIKGRR